MKELKTLSLSITRPLEESSLLMVLGGAGGSSSDDKDKNITVCGGSFTNCEIKINKCNVCVG